MIPVDPLASLDIFGQQRISIQEPHLTKSHIVDTLRLQKKRNDVNKQDAKFSDVFAYFSKKSDRQVDHRPFMSSIPLLADSYPLGRGDEKNHAKTKHILLHQDGEHIPHDPSSVLLLFLHHILSPPFQ